MLNMYFYCSFQGTFFYHSIDTSAIFFFSTASAHQCVIAANKVRPLVGGTAIRKFNTSTTPYTHLGVDLLPAMTEHPTATWQAMPEGNVFYRRQQLYTVPEKLPNLGDHIVAGCRHGGPLGAIVFGWKGELTSNGHFKQLLCGILPRLLRWERRTRQ